MKPANKIKIRKSCQLVLRRETILELTTRQLAAVAGGSNGCHVTEAAAAACVAAG